jgi:hypothetical protein
VGSIRSQAFQPIRVFGTHKSSWANGRLVFPRHSIVWLCRLPANRPRPYGRNGQLAREATGALPHEPVDPLDKRPGEDTILSTSRSEGLWFLAGRSGWQQPFAEERCDGYAALLLSASRGLVSRRRVCGHPLRRWLTGRGFFMTCRRLSLDRPYRLCYDIFVYFSRQQGNTFASIMGPHRRYSGRSRFFSDPPIRWGGICSQPHARRIMSWLMER